MFKVLGTIAISDRDFILCFACLFIYLFIYLFLSASIQKRRFTRSDFWPFGNSQLSWVDGCFDCFTARFHQAMKPIVQADYGSWKMCMNTLVAQIDKMFSFVCKHIINLICRKFTFPPLLDLVLDSCLKSLYFLPFLNPHKNRCV